MISTAAMSPLRRRVVIVTASTLALGVMSAVAPTRAIEAASAATPSTVASAGLVAATGTASAVKASLVAPVTTTPAPRAVPRVVVRAKTAAVAPFRVGTVGFSQWWAKKLMVKRYGWKSTSQFRCLVTLWNHESHWNYRSHNNRSGAHGIPQALPGSKMRSAGTDWLTNPITQIKWGLGYVHGRYSTPCGAMSHFRSHGWY